MLNRSNVSADEPTAPAKGKGAKKRDEAAAAGTTPKKTKTVKEEDEAGE